MSSRLPTSEKLALIKRAKSGEPIAKLCREAGVSRTIFYRWLKKYDSSGPRAKSNVLNPKNPRRQSHWRALPKKIEWNLLTLVARNSSWSTQKYAQILTKRLDRSISAHGVWRILKRHSLTTASSRKKWAEERRGKAIIELSPASRTAMTKAVLEQARPIARVSREFGVSRPTLYKWLKLRKAGKDLVSHRPRGVNHWRTIPGIDEQVLDLVKSQPEYGSLQIAKQLTSIRGDQPSLGNHGVYNLLKRHNLNLYEQRLAYARATSEELVQKPIPVGFLDRIRLVWEQFIPSLAPAPPPKFTKLLRTFLFASVLTFITSFGSLSWLRILGSAQTFSQTVGLIFATLALFMGSLFFIYSLKYYITLAIVLSFSQQESGISEASRKALRNQELGVKRRKRRGFISWLLGLSDESSSDNQSEKSKAIGLEPSLEHITLKRYPKISVHIPLYNEKNVVERLIAATTNFDYKGDYEVILADDSTDETTQIIGNYLKSTKSEIRNSKGDGWELKEVEVRPGVTLKHLHRTSRSGFKGGALKLALSVCDPRAEFVSVFDADFVPYPDTLELFLKYFQATAGTLDFKKGSRVQGLGSSGNSSKPHTLQPKASPIAAVQGYQWHVLNKSENWITRGVRSEYAGSYVIERSGEEIYGGLKQISGAVYMIRRDVLQEVGWETSITEDFELTLKLYEKGYKVVYTPYIQAPAECVSTLKRLIRQRMRWAEGHSNNIRRMFIRLMLGKWETKSSVISRQSSESEGRRLKADSSKRFIPSPLTLSEKLEFLYLSPYYLQAFFFLVGTISWLISETLLPARLPFWTSLWGWSLVLTNLLALPLMNSVGLFLEESEERDYQGILSFIALTYILVPFQAYASLKGLIQKEEGPWFRTPKTGRITDVFARGRFYRFISGILPGRKGSAAVQMRKSRSSLAINQYFLLATANNQFNSFGIKPRKRGRFLGKVFVSLLLAISLTLVPLADKVAVTTSYDQQPAFAFASVGDEQVKKNYSDEVSPDENQNLAVNTTKSVYELGEKVVIGMAVVDKVGRTVCNARIELRIMNQEFGIDDMLFTEDPHSPKATEGRSGTIENSPECGPKTVTNTPDYFAIYKPKLTGTYLIKVTTRLSGRTYVSESLFVVEEAPAFSVLREGPTRVYPESAYTMTITFIPQEDFSGEVHEVIPRDLKIKKVSEKGGVLRNIKNGLGFLGKEKEIVWEVDWTGGEIYKLSYTLKTPLISPRLYKMGPLRLGIRVQDIGYREAFSEARPWQVVIDTVSTVFDGLLSDATEMENQRKAFRKPIGDKEYYVFYKSSTNPDRFRYKHSTNGSSWSSEIDVGTTNIETDTNGSVDFKDRNGSTVDVVVTYSQNNESCRYVHGTVDGTTDAITWGTDNACGALDKGVHPSITIDQGDRVWIVSGEDSGNSNKIEIMSDNTANPTAPPDDINADKATGTVEDTISAQMHAEVVPLDLNEVGVIYLDHTNGNMYAKKGTFSSGITMSSRSTAFTGTFSEGVFSVVDEDEDHVTAYVLYRDGATVKQVTVTFDAGDTTAPTFGTAATIKSITPDSVSLSYDEGDNTLYAFYVDPADDTLIRWEQSDVCSSPPCDPFTWAGSEQSIDDGTGSEPIEFLSVGRRDWAAADQIPVTYTIQTTDVVRFVETPEFLWMFFGLAPLLPLLAKRSGRKKAFAFVRKKLKRR